LHTPAEGSTVTIWLVTGRRRWGRPVSRPVQDPAWDAIGSAGFNGQHYDEGCTNLATLGYEGCVVERQNPAPGTSLAKGSTVEIWLKNA
jgi:hypothetical protein